MQKMKLSVTLAILSTLALVAADHELRIRNNCPFTVWPAFQSNPGKSLPENGGFLLVQWTTKTLHVPDGWAGRIWVRAGCNVTGHCDSGNCDNKIQCQGAKATPPATQAEITLDGEGGQDYYDISLVNGYNLPIVIEPIQGTFRKVSDSNYDCNKAGCSMDVTTKCPSELLSRAGPPQNTHIIGCNSACTAFNTDEFCCRGAHNKPETCSSRDWKVNYPAHFKQSCPDAYTYAFDDKSSTFTCHGNPKTGYEIRFCF